MRVEIGRILAVAIATMAVTGCAQQQHEPDCSSEWQQFVERTVTSGDGMGHGPDIGSEEWKSVIEFKLGVRGQTGVPDRESPEWCAYVQNLIDSR